MINILTRSHDRPVELEKCIQSIMDQTYKKVHLIVSVDNDHTLQHTNTLLKLSRLSFEIIRVKNTGVDFHWNFYCNNLKDKVQQGWFLYLDSDDWLVDPHCLANLAPHLTDPNEGVICQFNRGVNPKPVYDYCEVFKRDNGHSYVKQTSIVRGKIGGSCIVLHHSQKDIAHWDGQRAADYRFIKAVSEQIPLKWVPVVVVQAGNKGRRGK